MVLIYFFNYVINYVIYDIENVRTLINGKLKERINALKRGKIQ